MMMYVYRVTGGCECIDFTSDNNACVHVHVCVRACVCVVCICVYNINVYCN